jgi:hypothetical protein
MGGGGFDPVSILTSLVVGQVAQSAFGGKKGGATPQPAAVTPPPEPQAAKTPDEAARRSSVSVGAAAAGQAGSTLLTGAQGVSPSTLSLGKNSLLGQ